MIPRAPSISLLFIAIIATVGQAQPAQGGVHWSPTGDLIGPRAYSPAVTLLDGRILVEGGLKRTHGFSLGSAEIFDPATGIWSATGSMLVARTNHTATTLEDGRVLVIGGLDRDRFKLAECELYDPNTGIWTTTTSYPSGPLAYHVAVRLQDGRVFVVGPLVSPLVYDPTTAMWADVGSLAFGWTEQTLTLMVDGRVLMAGGGDGGISNNGVWIYDPATTWESAPHLIQARQGHTATLLPDGRVLVAGGLSNGVFLRSAELYDPQTNQWSDAARLNTARAYHTATQLANGDVVIVGGASGPGNVANAEIYHIATGRWEPAGITPPVSHHAAGLLPDSHVLAIGGLRSSLSAIPDCEVSPHASQ